MRILIADTIDEQTVSRLKQAGHLVTYRPQESAVTLVHRVKDLKLDVIVVDQTIVREAAVQQGLKLIVKMGPGSENSIHMESCNEKGIFVAECDPDLKNDAKAELVIGMMVGVDRRISD